VLTLPELFFDNCDLYRAEFEKAIANKADFRSSYNYSIDPAEQNSKAQFSLTGLKDYWQNTTLSYNKYYQKVRLPL
jgi:hypothetical protein